MSIVIIDGNPLNRAAAQAQLIGRHLVFAGTYDEAMKIVGGQHGYKTVLIDLLMPPSKKNLSPKGKSLARRELPVGIFLALLAARGGAAYVAVVTEKRHQDHPASACFEAFNSSIFLPLQVEGAKIVLFNRCCTDFFLRTDLARKSASELYRPSRSEVVEVKDWRFIHDTLLYRC